MTHLAQELAHKLARAFEGLGLDPALGAVSRAQKAEFGHFQCNGALAGAKAIGKNPREIAATLASSLATDSDIALCEVAGPGFLNITFSDAALVRQATQIAVDPRAGALILAQPRKIIVDYAGPNVAKSMHVGHLRATIIGDAIKRIYRFRGDTVWGDAHFGDWGFQMGLLIAALADEQPDLPYFAEGAEGPFPNQSPVDLSDLERIYPMAAALAKTDTGMRERARKATAELQAGRAGYRALWQCFVSVSQPTLEREFKALGVTFDLWLGESDADPLIPAMIADLEAKGLLQDDQGARVVFVHDKMVPKKDGSEGPNVPPLLVVSSEGSAMYGTTDLATIIDRKKRFDPDLIIYCVDQRQAEHFETVFRAAAKAGYMPREALDHIGFGTMNGTDGKPFKTREGGVLKLHDLITQVREKAQAKIDEAGVGLEWPASERSDIAHKVGVAALKFADLQNFRGTSYVFDLDRFLSFEGKTGPYLLYAAVRIKSILRKALEAGHRLGPMTTLEPSERDLILTLDGFEHALRGAYDKRAPHILADHAYSLAGAFSSFYAICPILGAETSVLRGSRLTLAQATLKQLLIALELLGIETPDRM